MCPTTPLYIQGAPRWTRQPQERDVSLLAVFKLLEFPSRLREYVEPVLDEEACHLDSSETQARHVSLDVLLAVQLVQIALKKCAIDDHVIGDVAHGGLDLAKSLRKMTTLRKSFCWWTSSSQVIKGQYCALACD